MKILFRLVIVIECLIFACSTFAGSDWIIMSSQDQTVKLNDLIFPNIKNGWAVGKHGTIFHTQDGGKRWERQAFLKKDYDLVKVDFVSNQIGWVLGTIGVKHAAIFHTSDGGATWEMQYEVDEFLGGIDFVDAKEGWAVGSQVYHTQDGGITWEKVEGVKMAFSIQFVNRQLGWIGGAFGKLWQTVDGGKNWKVHKVTTDDFTLNPIYFLNEQFGWALARSYNNFSVILHTRNGEQSWEQERAGVDEFLEDIYFANVQEGWVVGSKGLIWHTRNGGGRWEVQTVPNIGSRNLYAIAPAGKTNIWVVGEKIMLERREGNFRDESR